MASNHNTGSGILKDYLEVPTQRKLFYSILGLFTVTLVYFKIWEVTFILTTLIAIWYAYDYIGEFTKEFVDPTGKYVLITGCDTGFGFEAAKAIRDIGFNVIACCYDDNCPGAQELKARPWVKKIEVVSLDVTSEQSVMMCMRDVKEICSNQGLWAVINNAGIHNSGAMELVNMETYHKVAEVNLFGPIRLTKACLPLLRQAKGRIVNVSSERGFNPWPMNSAYCVSKFGMEALSSVLRNELAKFQVKVISVVPGDFGLSTAILDPKKFDKVKEDLYDEHSKLSLQDQEKAYPKEQLDKFLKDVNGATAFRRTDNSNCRVVNAYIDSIHNLHPLTQYFVHGHARTPWDPLIILARLRPFIPLPVVPTVEKFFFKFLR